MEALDLLNQLRNQITQFRESELFSEYDSFRQDIRFIEIMINLAELSFENNRKVKIDEKKWFDGAYIIDNSFTGKWSLISDLYAQIVDLMESSNRFE